MVFSSTLMLTTVLKDWFNLATSLPLQIDNLALVLLWLKTGKGTVPHLLLAHITLAVLFQL
jgi:hypothetical protein